LQREGYSFDGCIHWLVGTKPTVSFYHIWNELIDMSQLQVAEYNEYCTIIDEEGHHFTAYNDMIKLEKEMKRVSPEDTRLIDQFISGINAFLDFPLPVERPIELMSISEKIGMMGDILPKLPQLLKWYRMSNADFAAKLHSSLLKRFFTISYPGCFTMLVTLINCGWLHKKGAGYPIGGSVKLSQLMEQQYLELGGSIHYQSRVEKILVQDNHACGIELDGKQHNADIVISAADGRSTIYQMLQGAYKSKEIINMYEKDRLQRPAPMMYFALGINRSFEGQSHWLFLTLKKSIVIDNKTVLNELALTIVNFDTTAAEPGKTCMTAMLSSNDCDYWVELRAKDKSRYDEEKKRICGQIIDALEEHFGDFKSHVEVSDLATPATYIRYTDNWQASAQGWSASKQTFTKSISKELPSLKNFYMAGQWVEIGGGVPMCMMSGRNTAQIICKRDKVEFIHNKNHPIVEM
jgi:phytoene dehydrogenase-like protein